MQHALETLGLRLLSAFARVLPARLARACGRGFGRLALGLGIRQRVCMTNLAIAFPGPERAAERRRVARRAYEHLGVVVFEFLGLGRLRRDELQRRLEIIGTEHLQAALAGGKGVIIFSGHFGYWELQALGHALVLPPMSVMARPLDNPYLHRLLEDIRRRTGNGVIYRQGGLRRVLRALHANECVGMLIDQHVHGAAAVTVDFFGRPVATTSALATLALRTGAPLVPVFALPLQRGRYRLIYEHPVEPPPAGCADPVQVLTQRCTDVLEMYVRRHPHFWLWMHRRWRDHRATETGQTATLPGSLDESESLE